MFASQVVPNRHMKNVKDGLASVIWTIINIKGEDGDSGFGWILDDIRLENIANVIECQPVFLEVASVIIIRTKSPSDVGAYDSEKSTPSVILEPSTQSLHFNL